MTIQIAKIHAKVKTEDIYYMSWNIDACDGLGFLQTDDAKNGLVTIFTPHNLLSVLLSFLDGLKVEGLNIEINSIEAE